MKKIAFYVDSLSKGGAERVISNLVNYFSIQNDYDVTLIILNEVKAEYEINKNVTIHYVLTKENINANNNILKKVKNLFLKIRNSKRIIKLVNANVIVSFLPDSCFLSLLTREKKNKVIISIRNDPNFEYKSLKNKILMRFLYPKCDGAIFQTEEAKEYFKNILKCESTIIPNPINPKFIMETYNGEREKKIVSVGRLEEQKNFKYLILAFNEFHKNNSDYKLVIYGEGNERENLQELVKRLELNDIVLLPGKVDNIKDEIYKASLFVLPSLFEGMPNALMEAMALGLPVISTDCPCGGPRFLITNNENGILVPVNDVEALKNAINRVIKDKEFQSKIAINASKISNDLSPEKISLKWKDYIEKVMSVNKLESNKKNNINLFKKIIEYLKRNNLLKWMPDKLYLELIYYAKFEKKIDWNNPKTYNEKLQWLKLHDRKDIYTMMVDKYEAKKYVANIIGEEYIIPTLGIYNKFDEIDFDKLPNQFVIKCTHDSGGLVICKDKAKFDKIEARKKIEKSLKINYYYGHREWPYKNIKPRIIVERYMKNEKTKTLNDYKLFCFNGNVEAILVCSNRNKSFKNTDFYDKNWNLMPFTRKNHKNNLDGIEKPKNLYKMIEIAEKLSNKIPFIRVDLYEINDKIYFGELTFYPSGGFEGFEPEEWEIKLGDMIDITELMNKTNKRDEKNV